MLAKLLGCICEFSADKYKIKRLSWEGKKRRGKLIITLNDPKSDFNEILTDLEQL